MVLTSGISGGKKTLILNGKDLLSIMAKVTMERNVRLVGGDIDVLFMFDAKSKEDIVKLEQLV